MFEENYIHPELAYKALIEIMDSELELDAEAMGIPSVKLRGEAEKLLHRAQRDSVCPRMD